MKSHRIPLKNLRNVNLRRISSWKRKIENLIDIMGILISVLNELISGNILKSEKGRKMMRKHRFTQSEESLLIKETLH